MAPPRRVRECRTFPARRHWDFDVGQLPGFSLPELNTRYQGQEVAWYFKRREPPPFHGKARHTVGILARSQRKANDETRGVRKSLHMPRRSQHRMR